MLYNCFDHSLSYSYGYTYSNDDIFGKDLVCRRDKSRLKERRHDCDLVFQSLIRIPQLGYSGSQYPKKIKTSLSVKIVF